MEWQKVKLFDLLNEGQIERLNSDEHELRQVRNVLLSELTLAEVSALASLIPACDINHCINTLPGSEFVSGSCFLSSLLWKI